MSNTTTTTQQTEINEIKQEIDTIVREGVRTGNHQQDAVRTLRRKLASLLRNLR